jgi:hypothetical protein
MPEIAVQPSFNGGEWSPNLYARVDMQKYRTAAALLENFFVDYRGGASTRPGSAYVIQAYKSATQVRIINFQASFNVGYVVEIGNGYMRFMYQGAPVLETAFNISAASQANPCVITAVGNDFVPGDWVYITGVVGMTQLNDRFFEVLAVAGDDVTLGYILDGANINSTAYTAYGSAGTVARIYTITSPYTSSDDLRQIKFAQSVNQMILCHPNHPVYVLTSASANNWSLLPATFGATISAPAAPTVTTSLAAGSVYYSYVVTAIDPSGQESSPSAAGVLSAIQDIRSTAGSNFLTWAAVPTAVGYNVYEATVSYGVAVPANVQYGFIGTTNGVDFVDSNIAQDFSVTPPISRNPFVGYSVASVTVTAAGTYTSVPTVSFTGASTVPAYATAVLGATAVLTNAVGSGYAVNDLITLTNGIVIRVDSLIGSGVFLFTVINRGAVTSGAVPANPLTQVSTTGGGSGYQLDVTNWGVTSVTVLVPGSGYTVAPTVGFSGAGGATATANLSAATVINPTVPGFVQQRLALAGPTNSPATFYMSKPGFYFNFDISNPIVASDAITGTLVSGTLNSIKSIVGSSAGMLILTDKAVWLVNGGSPGSAITPISAVANPQSYIGASDVPPLIINYDVVFVQSKGSAIRSLSYNVYFNIFTGNDISVMSSHLFFGYTVVEWCWAEQPFYIAQAVRDDGVLLSMTYMKDQEFIGWSHYVTNGLYKSVCSVTEELDSGVDIDAVYTVVQRTVGGNPVQYIERFAERSFPNGYLSAWCVDSGLRYSGAPATTFTGAEHLAGLTVTGLADGIKITPFVMPTTGIFTLPAAASTVTIGLAYACDLQTLPLDVGDPSVQGDVKKIQQVDIRVTETLGLQIGSSFSRLTPMKDLILGNVSSQLTGQPSQIVTDLVTGDAVTILDPTYTVPGQFCIRQSEPYPATILGVFPVFAMENRNER